jgi:twitching motility protein PilT
MLLDPFVEAAARAGASDLHLEPGLPPTWRVRGQLRTAGDAVPGDALLAAARELLPGDAWAAFLERRSADVGRAVAGVRCRVNAFCTVRGVGLAIRLLVPFQASIERLNLHEDLKRLVLPTHGLVVVSGPTGSGKSSTLAALIEEVNRTARRHVVTIESPIEYAFAPRLALIRQREVGRDTPSFEQALQDALREDPDVLMVGEVRDPESMRLALTAAETGHLVLTTLHSATVGEALQRVVASFAPEIQPSVCAQLADSLVGVVCQRLRFFPEPGILAPECEILLGTTQARSIVRQGQFFKIPTALETGGHEGCWTFARYREWLEKRTDWSVPPARSTDAQPEGEDPHAHRLPAPAARPAAAAVARGAPAPTPARAPPPARRPAPASGAAHPAAPGPSDDGRLSIDDADDDLDAIMSELERK